MNGWADRNRSLALIYILILNNLNVNPGGIAQRAGFDEDGLPVLPGLRFNVMKQPQKQSTPGTACDKPNVKTQTKPEVIPVIEKRHVHYSFGDNHTVEHNC